MGRWSVSGDDVTIGGFIKEEPTKVRTHPGTQKVRGRDVITKVVVRLIAVARVPPRPPEQS